MAQRFGANAAEIPDSLALTGTPTAPTAGGGTNTTQIATTAFVQAALAGAGSAISNPSIAHVQTNGDDGTAVIGDPSKPFATPQAAYNAGATVLCLGVGSFGGITGLSQDIMLIGCGATRSFVGNISGTAGSVYGNGEDNISVGSIYIVTPNGNDGTQAITDSYALGTDGNAGINAPTTNVSGLTTSGDAVLIAGNGGNGGNGADQSPGMGNPGTAGGRGGNGGAGGVLNVINCKIGGYMVSFGGNGGSGGNGGNSVDTAGAGGNGGDSGDAGSPGTVNIIRSHGVYTYAGAASAGTPGTGGNGLTPGNNGNAGAAGSAGILNVTEFSKVENTPTSGEALNVYQSVIAGTWNP